MARAKLQIADYETDALPPSSTVFGDNEGSELVYPDTIRAFPVSALAYPEIGEK